MDIRSILAAIAQEYPHPLSNDQYFDIPRIAFHLSVLRTKVPLSANVADIGGGIGLFSLGAAALGYRVTLIDDFGDDVNQEHPIHSLGLHERYRVCVRSLDAVTQPLELEPGSLDAVTSFDSMEHWHSSPKALWHALLNALRPGGLFFLGVPNCVNLRKRLTVPLGVGKWSSMEDWYEKPLFRGHVREPDVGDLKYIAEDLGLEEICVLGRNWAGYKSRFRWVRVLTPYADWLLRLRPSLCSDIYVTGKKPK